MSGRQTPDSSQPPHLPTSPLPNLLVPRYTASPGDTPKSQGFSPLRVSPMQASNHGVFSTAAKMGSKGAPHAQQARERGCEYPPWEERPLLCKQKESNTHRLRLKGEKEEGWDSQSKQRPLTHTPRCKRMQERERGGVPESELGFRLGCYGKP